MKKITIKQWSATALLVGGALACGKSVNLGALDSVQRNQPTGGNPNSTEPTLPTGDGNLSCDVGHSVQWKFKQPDAVYKKIVDLLFVVDTSGSMDPKRRKVAETIPQFISELAPDTDFRIAVMLAHGGKSKYTGRLYSGFLDPAPYVLDSTKMSVAKIQSELAKILKDPEDDVDEANGEAGMYSLMRSLEPDRLADIRKKGFFRANAALSVVFVFDENDICFPPESNGYSQFPDYVPSVGGIEKTAFKKYCRAPGQTASNTPALMYSKLAAFKGQEQLTLAAITHVDPARVPRGSKLEDSIGHGFIELVRRSPNGVLIDISDESYADGLSKLGNVVQSTLELLTRFALASNEPIQAETVTVAVDGLGVKAAFDAPSSSVELAQVDAGKAGSTVVIEACVGAKPAPTPTATPTVTPAPTPTTPVPPAPTPTPTSTYTPIPPVPPS